MLYGKKKDRHLLGRQLSWQVHVKTTDGESKMVKVLVDTGAQVNLVRAGLFQSFGEPARRPVCLQAVGGDIVAGGDKTLRLQLHLNANDCGSLKTYPVVLTDDFYVANINCDMIISFPF